MKKLLCLFLAVAAVGCFAGCVDHNDGKCDECGEKNATVKQYDEKTELCLSCATKKLAEELEEGASDLVGELEDIFNSAKK